MLPTVAYSPPGAYLPGFQPLVRPLGRELDLMTPQEFIAKWQRANLSERSACQQHFLDLCELLGQPKPAAADPDGAWYTFERGVTKSEGGQGWADVWMRGHFGWEYKGKRKNLVEAYQQLQLYREALENPPLLIVCDLNRFEVHTNFTGTATKVYAFDLAGLAEPDNLEVLRKVFTEPDALRPGETTEAVTQAAAHRLGQLADGLRGRGVPAPEAAHFLMKLMFCMFAEDVELLPGHIFSKALRGSHNEPAKLTQLLRSLFQAMAHGGLFGADEVLWFNGGLFADADVVELTADEIQVVAEVNEYDWASVEPSIFGTLFERTLDPSKRSQIGAHYTSRTDILTLLEPVVMVPLRREWADAKAEADVLWEKIRGKSDGKSRPKKPPKARDKHDRLLLNFVARLAHLTILDPACGSGNFLYVAINLLLDLEKEVIAYGATHGTSLLPQVRPTQLAGIEINPYAQQLAQVVIWIGYLQWMHHNGFNPPRNPVLEPIESIQRMDAILDLSDPEHPKEPEWPAADFIVGNPPFLGNKRMRSELGDDYSDALWKLYGGRLPATSDLCCYWFEKAFDAIHRHRVSRAGLLATTAIRQISSRTVLERIVESGRIFFAISDREWMLDGAAVRISIIGFDAQSGSESPILDNREVARINADLSFGSDFTAAVQLKENGHRCYMGTTKVGAFDIPFQRAIGMLLGVNPHGRPNSDVVRPFRNGSDIVRMPSDTWIVDFGVDRTIDSAALYEMPFEYVVEHVKPQRERNARKSRTDKWWLLGETLPAFRNAVQSHFRYVGTPRVSKHRVFVWLDAVILPDSKVLAITLADDFSLGVLHSRIHERWTLATCGWHGLGNDATYNPTMCFETFPFPGPTDQQRDSIAEAARELDQTRNNWLNPPEWVCEEVLEFPGSIDGPWSRYVHEPNSNGIGTVRYHRKVAKNEDCAKQLAMRTLTNLYNERPTWLDLAHRRLDEAACAAYGWQPSITDDQLLEKLLALNLQRAAAEQQKF